jgi:hypothetical protein
MIGLSREYRSYQKQLNPPWELTSVVRGKRTFHIAHSAKSCPVRTSLAPDRYHRAREIAEHRRLA